MNLDEMQARLDDFRSGRLPLQAFVQMARQPCNEVLNRLPPAFSDVWHNLLDRLESSALFAEESCSFSQKDLVDSMQLWINKAQERHKRDGTDKLSE